MFCVDYGLWVDCFGADGGFDVYLISLLSTCCFVVFRLGLISCAALWLGLVGVGSLVWVGWLYYLCLLVDLFVCFSGTLCGVAC